MLRHCLLDKGFKRCRYRPHLTTRSTMFLNNFVSLSAEEFFQVAIVKVTGEGVKKEQVKTKKYRLEETRYRVK